MMPNSAEKLPFRRLGIGEHLISHCTSVSLAERYTPMNNLGVCFSSTDWNKLELCGLFSKSTGNECKYNHYKYAHICSEADLDLKFRGGIVRTRSAWQKFRAYMTIDEVTRVKSLKKKQYAAHVLLIIAWVCAWACTSTSINTNYCLIIT